MGDDDSKQQDPLVCLSTGYLSALPILISSSPLVSLIDVVGRDSLIRQEDGVLAAEIKHLLGLPVVIVKGSMLHAHSC